MSSPATIKKENPPSVDGHEIIDMITHGHYSLDSLAEIKTIKIGATMIENYWQLQDAKNKFSNLVKIAQQKGPQFVTKHGKEAVVVLSINEYKRLTKPKTNLVQFFKDSPLAKEKVELSRSKDIPRDIEL